MLLSPDGALSHCYLGGLYFSATWDPSYSSLVCLLIISGLFLCMLYLEGAGLFYTCWFCWLWHVNLWRYGTVFDFEQTGEWCGWWTNLGMRPGASACKVCRPCWICMRACMALGLVSTDWASGFCICLMTNNTQVQSNQNLFFIQEKYKHICILLLYRPLKKHFRPLILPIFLFTDFQFLLLWCLYAILVLRKFLFYNSFLLQYIIRISLVVGVLSLSLSLLMLDHWNSSIW